MRIKVSYVEAQNLEQLQDVVSKELEAIQLNIKNKVAEVKTITSGDKYVAQIVYMEIDDLDKQILMEGETVDVLKNWYRFIY